MNYYYVWADSIESCFKHINPRCAEVAVCISKVDPTLYVYHVKLGVRTLNSDKDLFGGSSTCEFSRQSDTVLCRNNQEFINTELFTEMLLEAEQKMLELMKLNFGRVLDSFKPKTIEEIMNNFSISEVHSS